MKEKIKLLKKYGFRYDKKSDTWKYYKNRKFSHSITNYSVEHITLTGIAHWIIDLWNLSPKYKYKRKYPHQGCGVWVVLARQ